MELRIKEIAKEKKIHLKDIAKKMGIAKESLTRAIHGNPQLNTLVAIAEALEVNVIELFPQPNQNQVKGFLEYNGGITKINNTNDLLSFVEQLKEDTKLV